VRYSDAEEMAAALEPLLAGDVPHGRSRFPRIGVAAALAVAVLAGGGLWLVSLLDGNAVRSADVSFITRPHFGADVFLDGEPALDPDGAPHQTPCTIEGLPARPHHVEFRLPGQPRLDAGTFDFAEVGQITASWPTTTSP
jgi:hypothetical protein